MPPLSLGRATLPSNQCDLLYNRGIMKSLSTRCNNNNNRRIVFLLQTIIILVSDIILVTYSFTIRGVDVVPSDLPRRDDVVIGLDIVRQACSITVALQPQRNNRKQQKTNTDKGSQSKTSSTSSIQTISKGDYSPVTVADYAVQGVILQRLHEQFPDDGFIAEEDSSAVQTDEGLCQQIIDATGNTFKTVQDLYDSIDLGKSYKEWSSDNNDDGSKNTKQINRRPKRVWCLDPIDGTRGFLRGMENGGQYCIALALLEDGIPVIGILGCPNLPTDPNDTNYAWHDDETLQSNQQSRGCIFIATRNGGCYQQPLFGTSIEEVKDRSNRITVTPNDGSTRLPKDGRFCIGVEQYSDAIGQFSKIAQYIHGKDAFDSNNQKVTRIDSQAKHGCIARGSAEYYVRIPKSDYIEWIWDHAAGNVVIEEAGGTMTDTAGIPLDFSLGPQLSPAVRGVLMSNGGVFHTKLVEAYTAVAASATATIATTSTTATSKL